MHNTRGAAPPPISWLALLHTCFLGRRSEESRPAVLTFPEQYLIQAAGKSARPQHLGVCVWTPALGHGALG